MRSGVARQSDSARQYLGRDVGGTGMSTTVQLAADSLGYPMGMVNILDADELHTLAVVGRTQTAPHPRKRAVCHEVTLSGRPVVVADLRDVYGDEVTGDFPMSYVGVPLTGREGLVVGTLCLLDSVVRRATSAEVTRLGRFADVVTDQLELLRGDLGHGRTADPPSLSAADLQHGLEQGQLVPWYQTVVDLATDRVVGVEALARWDHPELGILPPSEFLPLAEGSELVIDVDLAVLDGALRDLRGWLDEGRDLRLNVNLSGRHFAHDECVDRFAASARDGGVPADRVSLELTESLFVAADEHDIGFVEQLRGLGFQVWLDDFGTGWSTLHHVLVLPADGLKIDRGVTGLLGTPKGDAVVRAVASMAADTGMGVVVEGVESPAQRRTAAALGCGLGQGYLWSKPVPAGEVTV